MKFRAGIDYAKGNLRETLIHTIIRTHFLYISLSPCLVTICVGVPAAVNLAH